MNLWPIVFYGIGDEDNQEVIFTIIDPELYIPLKEEVYTLIYTEEYFILTRDSLRRIEKAGSEIFSNLGIKMQGTIGISRLWVTLKSITIHGDPECFKLISEKMKEVLVEIFGKLSFKEVPLTEMKTARELVA